MTNSKNSSRFILKTGKYKIMKEGTSIKDLIHEKRRNVVKGGRGDHLTIKELIEKNPTVNILNEIEMGIQVEYEHTKDYWTSLDIAIDHLEEIPDYYTRLKKMEDEALKFWGK